MIDEIMTIDRHIVGDFFVSPVSLSRIDKNDKRSQRMFLINSVSQVDHESFVGSDWMNVIWSPVHDSFFGGRVGDQ